MKNKSAFSLIEVLVYTGIIAIVGTLFGGILVSVTNIQSKQTASGEVNQQLSFVMNNIQRIIAESSLIDMESGTISSTLTLRMQDPVKDKTLIYLDNGQIMLKEGDSPAVALTSSAVKTDSLSFYKISSYPGHDSVQIDLTMSYNTDNPSQTFSQKLSSAVARVSAATFDSDLIPGATNNYDIGLASLKWKNLYLSGDLTVDGKTTIGSFASDPSGADGMIYYNTVSKTYRAYSNGGWTNLGSTGPWTVSGANIYNNNAGNVGIGKEVPVQKLDVVGNAVVSGNFGVGTTSPSKKLDVDGEVRSIVNGVPYYMVPKGAIIMWSGTLASIPSSWNLCDGTNGTPDLRDKFVEGASAGQDPGGTGGSATHTHPLRLWADYYWRITAYDWQTHLTGGGGSMVTPESIAPGTAPTVYQYSYGNFEGTRTPMPTGSYPGGQYQLDDFLGVIGDTFEASSLPPYYKIAYIMKL